MRIGAVKKKADFLDFDVSSVPLFYLSLGFLVLYTPSLAKMYDNDGAEDATIAPLLSTIYEFPDENLDYTWRETESNMACPRFLGNWNHYSPQDRDICSVPI